MSAVLPGTRVSAQPGAARARRSGRAARVWRMGRRGWQRRLRHRSRRWRGISRACALAHPEAGALDRVADDLFAAGKGAAVEERADLRALALVDDLPQGLMLLQDLLDPIGGGDLLQHRDRGIALARVKKRKGPVVAGHGAVEPGKSGPRPAATEGVDDEGQRHLVEPGIERLADELRGRVVADRQRRVEEPLAEGPGTGAEEPAGVEVEVAFPVLVGLGEVERGAEVEAEAVVERFPDRGVAGAIEFDL